MAWTIHTTAVHVYRVQDHGALLAEISVRSPRKLVNCTINKEIIDWIKRSNIYLILKKASQVQDV